MHSNAECRTQNPSLNQVRPTQAPLLMGRNNASLNTSTSKGLAVISLLSDSEKARLFDHLHSQANVATTSQQLTSSTQPSSASPNDANDHTVYFANAYSAIAQSTSKSDEMISDSGADRFIFHSLERFTNLHAIKPVSIKTADRSCHMTSHYAGDAVVK